MKITIALPAHYNSPVGGYLVQYRYANLLQARGHQVTIVFPRSLQVRTELKERLKAPLWALKTRLKNRPLLGSFKLHDGVKVRLLPDLSGGSLPRADVLIATAWQTAEAMQSAPGACGRKYYVVYDYEFFMTEPPEIRERMRRTYLMAYGIVSTSAAVAEMIRDCGGTPAAHIPCGLDFAEFGMDVAPDQRQPLTLGFPARRTPFKGAADAIEAAGRLRARFGERLRVTAFGIQPLELPDWIQWLQYPSQLALRRFYNQNAVFLLPSHYEGWGLPGVEAMACGAALVVTDNGGSRDYAIDEETALVVPPRRPDLMAAAVARLFDDTPLRLRLARQGHQYVQRYTWDDAADRLEALLRGA
jgi:glycosyltransferase involved in cell wall biosynthesis